MFLYVYLLSIKIKLEKTINLFFFQGFLHTGFCLVNLSEATVAGGRNPPFNYKKCLLFLNSISPNTPQYTYP